MNFKRLLDQLQLMINNSKTTLELDEADIVDGLEVIRFIQDGVSKRQSLSDFTIPSTNGSTATFAKGEGKYVSSPTSPISSVPIALDKTNAVKGGFSMIWYKGAVLVYTDFTGGDIVIFNDGDMVEDELCRIQIDYDKTNNAFTVGILTGATGVEPSADIENAPTNLVLTEGTTTATENAPTNLVLTEGTTTVTENAPTNLILTEGTF